MLYTKNKNLIELTKFTEAIEGMDNHVKRKTVISTVDFQLILVQYKSNLHILKLRPLKERIDTALRIYINFYDILEEPSIVLLYDQKLYKQLKNMLVLIASILSPEEYTRLLNKYVDEFNDNIITYHGNDSEKVFAYIENITKQAHGQPISPIPYTIIISPAYPVLLKQYDENPEKFKTESLDNRLSIARHLYIEYISMLKKPLQDILDDLLLPIQLIKKLNQITNILLPNEEQQFLFEFTQSLYSSISEYIGDLDKHEYYDKFNKYIEDINKKAKQKTILRIPIWSAPSDIVSKYISDPELFKTQPVDKRLLIAKDIYLDFIDMLKISFHELFYDNADDYLLKNLSIELTKNLNRITNILSIEYVKKILFELQPVLHEVMVIYNYRDISKLFDYIEKIFKQTIKEYIFTSPEEITVQFKKYPEKFINESLEIREYIATNLCMEFSYIFSNISRQIDKDKRLPVQLYEVLDETDLRKQLDETLIHILSLLSPEEVKKILYYMESILHDIIARFYSSDITSIFKYIEKIFKESYDKKTDQLLLSMPGEFSSFTKFILTAKGTCSTFSNDEIKNIKYLFYGETTSYVKISENDAYIFNTNNADLYYYTKNDKGEYIKLGKLTLVIIKSIIDDGHHAIYDFIGFDYPKTTGVYIILNDLKEIISKQEKRLIT